MYFSHIVVHEVDDRHYGVDLAVTIVNITVIFNISHWCWSSETMLTDDDADARPVCTVGRDVGDYSTGRSDAASQGRRLWSVAG